MDARALVAVLAVIGGAAWLLLRSRSSTSAGVDLSNPLAGLDLSIPSLFPTSGDDGETLFAQVQNLGGALAPRGIRNRNPGNIRKDGTPWQGLAPAAQQTDPDFFVFSDATYGLRAIARIMLNKQARGLVSVRQLISGPGGWAPSTVDDNPAGYTGFVAGQLGVDPDAPLDLGYGANLAGLVAAVVQFENGQQPYSTDYIAQAVALA